MAAWPNIRQPLADGWTASEPDGVRATSVDAGPVKKRVESTAVAEVETLVFKLNATDRDTLKTFYAANKALRFTYTHPIWGAIEGGFNAPIKWTKKGAWFMATVSMEVYR